MSERRLPLNRPNKSHQGERAREISIRMRTEPFGTIYDFPDTREYSESWRGTFTIHLAVDTTMFVSQLSVPIERTRAHIHIYTYMYIYTRLKFGVMPPLDWTSM